MANLNAQHSASSGDYGTPPWIVEIAREVFGNLDLDLASSAEHNAVVKARHFCSAEEPPDSYRTAFAYNLFCNPPGSCPVVRGKFSVCGNVKVCSCKLVKRFHTICLMKGAPTFWVGFNLNQLRTLPWPEGTFICVLNKRVEYLAGGVPQTSPSHDSFLALINGRNTEVDTFRTLLRPHGKLMEVL